MYDVAKELQEIDFTTVPFYVSDDGRTKYPTDKVKWKEEYKDADEWKDKYMKSNQIAIICGGELNVQAIDVDQKNDPTKTINNELSEHIRCVDSELYDKLVIETTFNGGLRFIFRRQGQVPPKFDVAKSPEGVLIEMLGDGWACIVSPSKGYKNLQGELAGIEIITDEEYECLLEICKRFNQIDNEKIEDQIKSEPKDDPSLPGDDWGCQTNIPEFLEVYGWKTLAEKNGVTYLRRPGKDKGGASATWNYGGYERFWIFSSSTDFQADKMLKPFHIYAYYEHNGDHNKAAKALKKQGYGKPKEKCGLRNEELDQFIEKVKSLDKNEASKFVFSSDYVLSYISDSQFSILKIELKNIVNLNDLANSRKEKIKKAAQERVKKRKEELVKSDLDCFWDENSKIDQSKLSDFLMKNGFCKIYPYTQANSVFVKIENKTVDQVSDEQIQDFVLQYLDTLPSSLPGGINKNELLNNIESKANGIFSDGRLKCLRPKKTKFLRSKEDKCFLYFKNGFIEITKEDINLKPYNELPSFIWKDQIINREFNLNRGLGDFERFITLITSNNKIRKKALCSAIGYLLHDFKNKSKPYAIILCDEAISDEPNGRSGKSLVASAISQITSLKFIDGKQYKEDSQFAFSRVNIGDRVICFDDVSPKFDFEKLFHMITADTEIEKKGLDRIQIPFEESPKYMITTNYTIQSDGESSNGRKREYEISPHFHTDWTPENEFKQRFFDGWEKEEWEKFETFMIQCIQIFLSNGVLTVPSINLEKKKLIEKTSYDFVEWAESNLTIKHDLKINDSDKYHEYIKEYFLNEHQLKKNSFNIFMKAYSKYKGFNYTRCTDREDGKVKHRYKFTKICSKVFHKQK